AADGIRDFHVTGVQTCALPILPQGLNLELLDSLFATANPGQIMDIPRAVGFCMYIRRECLDQIGLFDEERFGRGYGEENDFSMRSEERRAGNEEDVRYGARRLP